MAIQSVKPVVPPGVVKQEQSRPVTLQHAANAIEHDFKKWRTTKAPKYSEWTGIARRLAVTERAVAGLLAVNSVLREHYFASETAAGCESEYLGITGFQAGGLGDAQEALTCLIYDQLTDVRDALGEEA